MNKGDRHLEIRFRILYMGDGAVMVEGIVEDANFVLAHRRSTMAVGDRFTFQLPLELTELYHMAVYRKVRGKISELKSERYLDI